MTNRVSTRVALLRLLRDFECKVGKQWWGGQRFSLWASDCGHPEADVDFIFLWKAYDQHWLAGKSQRVFRCLSQECGSMAAGIRELASLPEGLEDAGLKECFHSGELARISRPIDMAVQLGQGGWRELGFAIGAAKRLSAWFPGSDRRDYVLYWISRTLHLGVEGREKIVAALNKRVDSLSGDYEERFETLGRMLTGLSGGKGSQRGLPGVGRETVRYFVRDWEDVHWWKFMFKADEHNKAFWGIFFEAVGARAKADLARQLVGFLEPQDIENGVLAKLNKMAYTMRSGLGWGLGDDELRVRVRDCLDRPGR